MNNGGKIIKMIYPKKKKKKEKVKYQEEDPKIPKKMDHIENKANPKEKAQIKLIKNQLNNRPQEKQINHKEKKKKKRNQKAYLKMLKKKKLRKN